MPGGEGILVLAGSDVNARTDWRTRWITGRPQSKRYVAFPGIAERIVFTGPVMPGDFEVYGYIEGVGATRALAKANLKTNIDTEVARQSVGEISVELDTIAHGDFELAVFEVMGPMIAFVKSGSNNAVKVPVRYHFRKLSGS